MSKDIKEDIKNYYDVYFGINALYDSWAKVHGLTSNALFVLFIIHEHPNQCTQRFICQKLQFPKQTVNTVLDSFERKGYVRKTVANDDKRNKYIFLTEEGQKYADSILGDIRHSEESAMLDMGTDERTSMISGGLSFFKQLTRVLSNPQ